jgi:hypothetical protein
MTDAPPPPATDMDRIRANREIGRAFRAVQAVRTFYWVLAALNALYLLYLAVQLGEFEGVARTVVLVVLCIHGALIVLYVVGALRLRREPFVWALIVSLLQTLVAVARVAQSGLLAATVSILLAAFCWAAFATIAPAVKLMRQYPDLRITQRVRGRRAGRRS